MRQIAANEISRKIRNAMKRRKVNMNENSKIKIGESEKKQYRNDLWSWLVFPFVNFMQKCTHSISCADSAPPTWTETDRRRKEREQSKQQQQPIQKLPLWFSLEYHLTAVWWRGNRVYDVPLLEWEADTAPQCTVHKRSANTSWHDGRVLLRILTWSNVCRHHQSFDWRSSTRLHILKSLRFTKPWVSFYPIFLAFRFRNRFFSLVFRLHKRSIYANKSLTSEFRNLLLPLCCITANEKWLLIVCTRTVQLYILF